MSFKPQTPRGFRDVLPGEAAWRESLRDNVQACFKSWGYMPIETPTLEISDVLEAGGSTATAPIALFDSDGKMLCLRPDVTLPIARMVASRLADDQGPFRFRYTQQVFRESASLQAQSREFTQLGVECIGESGLLADVEVVTLFVEALRACNLKEFTVSICSVDVLYELLLACSQDETWLTEVLGAYHATNYVELERLAKAADVDGKLAEALVELPHISGGTEAIDACRKLLEGLVEVPALDTLADIYTLIDEAGMSDCVKVDFSILSSFDYYTGLVMDAYAPGYGLALGGGGRYDGMLAEFGRDLPAAGFAFSLEGVMQALRAQGEATYRRSPDAIVGGMNPQAIFAKAAQLRNQGKRVIISNPEDLTCEASRLGIPTAYVVFPDGSAMEIGVGPEEEA